MANEQFNLDELFNEIDKKKFLIHFEYFIKHEEKWSDINGKRLNINDIVTKITENLLNNVCLSGFKYEKLLLKLPWQKYLFNIDDDDDNGDDNEEKSLRPQIFINFIAEYIRIFPNRCEKFLDDFLFFLRGNTLHKASESNEIVKIQDKELQLFNCFKQTIQTLIINVKNLEFILTRLMKKRYPFIHNSIVHEFQCYAYNIINFIELLSHDNAIDLLDFLFQKLLSFGKFFGKNFCLNNFFPEKFPVHFDKYCYYHLYIWRLIRYNRIFFTFGNFPIKFCSSSLINESIILLKWFKMKFLIGQFDQKRIERERERERDKLQ